MKYTLVITYAASLLPKVDPLLSALLLGTARVSKPPRADRFVRRAYEFGTKADAKIALQQVKALREKVGASEDDFAVAVRANHPR